MPLASTLALLVHALFAAVWVGGMVFAFTVLRPAVADIEPPQRMNLLAAVFRRFFIWVWHAVILLPVSGYVALFAIYGGMDGVGVHVHLMQGIGWLMIALFLVLFFGPYKRFRAAVAAQEWSVAGSALSVVRRLIGINMVLGLITVAIGASGRFWG